MFVWGGGGIYAEDFFVILTNPYSWGKQIDIVTIFKNIYIYDRHKQNKYSKCHYTLTICLFVGDMSIESDVNVELE